MLLHIQILRFLAAASVVAFHAWGVAPKYNAAVPEGVASFLLSRGGHGVDLFFVISGFIIFYATQGKDGRLKHAPADFLRRRVERVVPLYFFVIALVTALAFAEPKLFGEPGWYTPRHILKSLAFISFTDGDMPVVYVGWSLEYEMYFYLAVALLMAFTRDAWRNIVMIFCALTMIGQLPGVASTLGTYSFFTDALILEFVLGLMVGHLIAMGKIPWPMLASAAIALAAVLVADPGNRAITVGLPSALLVAGAAWLSRKRSDPSRAEHALARLGDASYSIYLAQVQTVSLMTRLLTGVWPAMPPLLLIAAVSAIVIAFGLVLNIAVEKPLLQFCRRLGKPRPSQLDIGSAVINGR